MSRVLKSGQEAVLQALVGSSMGAPFVIAPEILPRSKREPADLVWACNNCVMLMHMTERKAYADSTKNKGARKKAIEHNLRRAQGGVNEWKSGRTTLEGRNRCNTFSIRYKDGVRVVLLSVIKCSDAVLVHHDDIATKLGVDVCVTVPQSAIEFLANCGGTMVNLVSILGGLRGRQMVPEKEVLASFEEYTSDCLRTSGAEEFWAKGQFDARFTVAAALFWGCEEARSSTGIQTNPVPVLMI